MLEGEFDNLGRLSSLSFGGSNFISPWGIELSDSHTFFSLDRSENAAITEDRKIELDDAGIKRVMSNRLVMPTGSLSLNSCDVIGSTTVRRTLTATFADQMPMIDLVLRYVFDPDQVGEFQLDGKTITDDRSNMYHQRGVSEVSFMVNGRTASIELIEASVPDSFHPVIYVKSHPTEGWVVHIRIIPKTRSGETLRIRGRRMPSLISSLAGKIPLLSPQLRYARETNRQIGHVAQLMPYAEVPQYFQMTLDTKFTLK